MKLSYKNLWKHLVDEGLNKTQFRLQAEIGTGTLAKLGRNEPVGLDVLAKICFVLKCNIGDVVEFVFNEDIKNG